jgi:MFS family permease
VSAEAMTTRPLVRAEAQPSRTLAVTAAATLLVLASFSVTPATVIDTARSVHAGVAGQTWALSGMSLGLATALLTVGALADDFGRRRVLVWSAGLLALASALAALAPSIGVFVAARVLQGGAGAGVIAASLAAIGHAFPDGAERTRATGVWGAAVGGGIALGPVLGALLVAPLGWRSGYWLQAIAAAGLVAAAARIAESRAAQPRPVYLAGVATLGAGMASLTAGIVEGRTSWTSTATIVLIATGVVLLGLFVAVELWRRAPMVDLRLVREPLFVASLTGAVFTGVAIIGLMSYSLSFMQRGLGLGVVTSATVLVAWSGTSMVVALAARRLPAVLASPLRLTIGLALAGAGEIALTGLSAGSDWARLVPGLALAGVGSGIANAALGRLAVESVPHERAGMGSGANNTARYLGGAAGVALVVAVVARTGSSPAGLVHGWNTTTLACAALCFVGAGLAALTTRPARSAPA